MAALKAHEVDRFVAKPDATAGLVLLYGPDQGLISERSSLMFKALGAKTDDPFSFITLDGDALASDPSRLVEEAATRSMFGGLRFIRVRVGSRAMHASVQSVLKVGPLEAFIVLEAGDLKKGAPLRSAVESAAKALALPCYQDNKAQIAKLIDDELSAAGQSLTPDGRQMLIRSLGGDREASRAEIRKLSLYAHGQKSISADDVAAICGDASSFTMSSLIDAAFSGQSGELEVLFRKSEMEGLSTQAILAAALRHASGLHKAALALQNRAAPDVALRHVDGMASFSRKPLLEQQMRAWKADSALWAYERMGEAVADSRASYPMASVLTHRALLAVAERAKRLIR